MSNIILETTDLKKSFDRTNGSITLFENLNFVFSGFRNKEWEQLIELGGGKVSGTVSGNTDVLVVKDKSETSSKIKKAKDLGSAAIFLALVAYCVVVIIDISKLF